MKYWIKSTPPLIIRKAYADSMTELMEWIEELIRDTKREYEVRKEKFPPKKDFDIFKKCFVLISVDTDKFPHTFEALGVDVPSKAKVHRARRRFSSLWKEWSKVAGKPKMKSGRKNKSDKIQTAAINLKQKKNQ